MPSPAQRQTKLWQLSQLALQLFQEGLAGQAVDQEPGWSVDGHQQAGHVAHDECPGWHIQARNVHWVALAAQVLVEVPGECKDKLDKIQYKARQATDQEQHHDDDQHPGTEVDTRSMGLLDNGTSDFKADAPF